MADHFTETTHTSWFGRLGDSFKGIAFGIIFFLVGIVLIWINEGSSVKRMDTIEDGLKVVVSVPASPINKEHNQKLIHTSGMLETNAVLKDLLFGVGEKAIHLKRSVEMYQWHEHVNSNSTTNSTGSSTQKTTYVYEKKWSTYSISSERFKHPEGHTNVGTIPYQSKEVASPSVTLGSFTLGPAFRKKLEATDPYYLSQKNFDAMEPALQKSFKLHDGMYWRGNPGNPQIGDIRIHYKILTPMEATLVGKQRSDRVGLYHAKKGEIALLNFGLFSAEDMFTMEIDKNRFETWAMRGIGLLLVWIGLCLILKPLSVLGDAIPFFGSILSGGIFVISILLALSISLSVMSIAWLYHRPLMSATLLCVTFVSLFLIMKNRKEG